MTKKTNSNEEELWLHNLRHYLPTQSPLKDFIHHNTLHAFQELPFHEALQQASETFGYRSYMPLEHYRKAYAGGRISEAALDSAIQRRFPKESLAVIKQQLLHGNYNEAIEARIGAMHGCWHTEYHFSPEKQVHPTLFRIIGMYLDQGISTKPFPGVQRGLLAAVRKLESDSYISLFQSERARLLLLHSQCKLGHLLSILVGNPEWYEQYLFDQQFAHPGWSGMVAVLEAQPQSLLDGRKITLHDFIALELLLEIDALDSAFGTTWPPLADKVKKRPSELFATPKDNTLFQAYALWQEAYEFTYYDSVLAGLSSKSSSETASPVAGFDALFCIDDRECSLRRHLESLHPGSRTFGTPGFFNIDCYYQPEHGKFHTKICPAPMQPGFLIKESHNLGKTANDTHYTKKSHGLLMGWLIAQTLGFWSALKLFINIFKPSVGPATTYSFRHSHQASSLSILASNPPQTSHGLQIGYTIEEMADRVESLLLSIGLHKGVQEFVYVVGHGASSINNTHYAGYDCGACSGRPGSVNARAFATMANHPQVRAILAQRGLQLDENTRFIGALHDTTRDEIQFYDLDTLSEAQKATHTAHVAVFEKALQANAVERSRRFELLSSHKSAEAIHKGVKHRSVSLFEPRPELNHATNALCIIGPRSFSKHVFLDRRAFMNSYDPELDHDGKHLLGIIQAAAPVCGGINLEYYFSRVDNYRLGAGTKLPHNVMGLIGVANGTDGDLLTGLPRQMVEVHEPVRLLMVIYQRREVILKVLQEFGGTADWLDRQWVHLACIDPENGACYLYQNQDFVPYTPQAQPLHIFNAELEAFLKLESDLPVMIMEDAAWNM